MNTYIKRTLFLIAIIFLVVGVGMVVFAVLFVTLSLNSGLFGDEIALGGTLLLICGPIVLAGGAFALIGLLIILWPRLKKRKQAKLLATGTRVKAEILRVYEKTSLSVNGYHPYIIECVWTERASGNTYIFRSPNIWDDPGLLIDMNKIKTLPVYYDPANIKNYVVDMSALTQYGHGRMVRL